MLRLRDAEMLRHAKVINNAPILDTPEHDVWMVEVSVLHLVVGFLRDRPRKRLEIGKAGWGISRCARSHEEHEAARAVGIDKLCRNLNAADPHGCRS